MKKRNTRWYWVIQARNKGDGVSWYGTSEGKLRQTKKAADERCAWLIKMSSPKYGWEYRVKRVLGKKVS